MCLCVQEWGAKGLHVSVRGCLEALRGDCGSFGDQGG